MLEALGSIPTVGEKKFGDGASFLYHLQVSQVTEFDLGVKWVQVNLSSSFEQITMGSSSQCYIHGFKAIIPLVLEKKIFEDFIFKCFYHIQAW